MTDPNRDENPLQGWHVSKTINLGHLATTVAMLMSVLWFFSVQDARIGQVELNIQHLQVSRDADQARTDKKFDEIRGYMLRIESKLDRVIESDR